MTSGASVWPRKIEAAALSVSAPLDPHDPEVVEHGEQRRHEHDRGEHAEGEHEARRPRRIGKLVAKHEPRARV